MIEGLKTVDILGLEDISIQLGVLSAVVKVDASEEVFIDVNVCDDGEGEAVAVGFSVLANISEYVVIKSSISD